MKKLVTLCALSLLAALILLPAASYVNYTASKPIIADGNPLPWPKPPVAQANTVLTADGNPLPWPKPPVAQANTVLTADGNPLPWPKPPVMPLAA